MEDSSSSIQVGIRIRPLGPKENIATDYFAWKIKGNVLARINSSGKLLDGEQFEFSRVFGPESDNAVVYRNCVAPLVESALQGFNATVFAYGQTASGKTHTMTGNSNDPGLIPLALREIFKGIQAIQDREFLLRISLLEIYNEELKDLFDPSRNDLGLFADKDKSYSVKNLSEHIITSADQALDMILASEKNRHYGKTEMNDISSRSHVILKLTIENGQADKILNEKNPILVSTINFVDLAGSERISKTSNDLARAGEGIHINSGLFHLGRVISKLINDEKHIPFRDSKLTRILQSSLGGNSKTAVICTMSPASSSISISISTLRFAQNARKVRNQAKINVIFDDEKILIRKHHEKIASLTQELDLLKKQLAIETKTCEQDDIESLKKTLQEKINHMQTLILGSRNHKEKDIENEGPRRRFSIGADHAIQFSTPRKLSHAESSFFKDKFVEQQCQSIKFKSEKISDLESRLNSQEKTILQLKSEIQKLKNQNSFLTDENSEYKASLGWILDQNLLRDLSLSELEDREKFIHHVWKQIVREIVFAENAVDQDQVEEGLTTAQISDENLESRPEENYIEAAVELEPEPEVAEAVGRVPYMVSKIEEAISPQKKALREFEHLSVSKNITRRRINHSTIKPNRSTELDISSLDLSIPANSPLLKREFEGNDALILQTPFKFNAKEILEKKFAHSAGLEKIFKSDDDFDPSKSSTSSYLQQKNINSLQ